MPVSPALIYVDMKTRRAQVHLEALELAVKNWVDSPPYTIIERDDFQKAVHVVRIEDEIVPEIIPMLLGDFVCCLRAALDQLAWALTHFRSTRTFTDQEARRIQFPIAKVNDATYQGRLGFFPSTVASDIDSFQPYHRGSAYASHPLWELNELWTMDKHRAIPMNANSFTIHFSFSGWERYLRHFENAVEVHFPLVEFYKSPVSLKPHLSVEVLFGEHMGQFEVSMPRLREINDFVRNDVIPRFTGFFT